MTDTDDDMTIIAADPSMSDSLVLHALQHEQTSLGKDKIIANGAWGIGAAKVRASMSCGDKLNNKRRIRRLERLIEAQSDDPNLVARADKHKGWATRDRLRAKLEAKRAAPVKN